MANVLSTDAYQMLINMIAENKARLDILQLVDNDTAQSNLDELEAFAKTIDVGDDDEDETHDHDDGPDTDTLSITTETQKTVDAIVTELGESVTAFTSRGRPVPQLVVMKSSDEVVITTVENARNMALLYFNDQSGRSVDDYDMELETIVEVRASLS